MRISISAGFCAGVCFLGWLEPLVCAYFLFSAVIHELGHVLLLTILGFPIWRIRVDLCGAVMETAEMGNIQEFICASAGPIFSILFGLAMLQAAPKASLISFGLAAVNLLPLYPLDGGRMLRSFLLLWCSAEHTERIVRIVTFAICLLLMLLACWLTVFLQAGIWPIFAALVLLWKIGNA